jgi:predicted nucleic acid-binding protein
VATYLLDTSVIIDALNNKGQRREFLLDLLTQGNLLACCSVNVTEVYAGMRPKEEPATEALLKSLEYYHVTWPVARLAGLLKRDYAKKGASLTTADTTIAAVAMVNGLTLLTDNIKDFPMKELVLYPLPLPSNNIVNPSLLQRYTVGLARRSAGAIGIYRISAEGHL